jgi:hypothetical protein
MQVRQLVSVIVMLLSSSAALPGTNVPLPVIVKLNPDGSGFAQGSMSTARFSAHPLEAIGCAVAGYSTGYGDVRDGFCSARTGGGIVGGCYANDVRVLDALQSISSYSSITFRWNPEGICTSVQVHTHSGVIP